MITLTISDEKLQESFDKALDSLMTPGTYDNPVKRSLEKLIGYSGDPEIIAAINKAVKDFALTYLESSEFKLALGTAMAAELAKRQIDSLKK